MARPPPPPPTSLYANPIPFAYFATLVDRVGAVAAKKRGARSSTVGKAPKEHRLLAAWIDGVRAEHRDGAVPDGTVVLFFRLFFPDEGVRRRCVLSHSPPAAEVRKLTLSWTSRAQVRLAGAHARRGARVGLRRQARLVLAVERCSIVELCGGRELGLPRPGGREVAREARQVGQEQGQGAHAGTVRPPSSHFSSKTELTPVLARSVDELLDELATLSTWSSADGAIPLHPFLSVPQLMPLLARSPAP